MACDLDLDRSTPWSQHHNQNLNYKNNYPYSPSIASSASSSSDSVFSIDAPSSQSSEASEGWSDPSSWVNDTENPYVQDRDGTLQSTEEVLVTSWNRCPINGGPFAPAIAPESRQHPRRTQRLHSYESQDGISANASARPPPSLVRQSERKDNFVDSLVDTTTQMIEAIWPLSVLSCGRDIGLNDRTQNLIGLRTFVQEVLRRSKTSYSTLQVALYYLILVQSCLPKHDLTMEQSEDSSTCRAMQCGRRMFLAALMLASKYLQDRNYSTRAWSKISGLTTCEINSNELAFLIAVNWKLHIPEAVFHRWTDIVLKYSPSAQVNACPRSSPIPPHSWKMIVPHLTPELEMTALGSSEVLYHPGHDSPHLKASKMSPPPRPICEELSPRSTSNELTPTPANAFSTPQILDTTPRGVKADGLKLPPLPHLGLLPTPQMTPQTGNFCTPAVSASSFPNAPSMSHAMSQVQKACLARTTLDNPSRWRPSAPGYFPTCSRRSSLARTVSSVSSPESMISDVSSRTSRSSSISSVASSNCALPPPRLAVQATRRCANMQLCGLIQENQHPISKDEGAFREWILDAKSMQVTNPETQTYDMGVQQAQYLSTYPNEDTREAATALRDLHLSRQHQPQVTAAVPRPPKGLKRSRPNSMDLSVQSSVRDMIAPRCLGDITNTQSFFNRKPGTVMPDAKLADSFLVPKTSGSRPSSSHSNLKPALSGECLPRKRTCAGSDRGGKEEARLMMRKFKEGMQGSGQWESVI